MDKELEELKSLLRDAMGMPSKGVMRLIAAHDKVPAPGDLKEGDEMARVYIDMAGVAITCAILFHIRDHSEQSCSIDIFEYYMTKIHKQVLEDIARGCKECNLQNPWDVSKVNTNLVKEMLASDDE